MNKNLLTYFISILITIGGSNAAHANFCDWLLGKFSAKQTQLDEPAFVSTPLETWTSFNERLAENRRARVEDPYEFATPEFNSSLDYMIKQSKDVEPYFQRRPPVTPKSL